MQICWGDLEGGPVVVRACDQRIELDHGGGPGAVTIDGLESGVDIDIDVRSEGAIQSLRTRTLVPPPGEVLARFATVSDLHIGATHWGFFKTMVDSSGHREPAPARCARAAITEAVAWGADHLVIKGDAVQHRCSDHFTRLGALLDEFADLPATLLPGNHDVDDKTAIEVPATIGRRRLPYVRSVTIDDLAGLRLVSVDTTIERRGTGTLEVNGPAALDAAAGAATPVMVLLHHQIQPHMAPTHYPPGIARADGRRFLDALARITPDAWVTSGHTHRNRARRVGPIQVSEVASTRDWPGVWAGYEIREGGVTQTVRRVEADDAITWHEYSRGAVGGVWSAWAPGSLSSRCVTKRWTRHLRM